MDGEANERWHYDIRRLTVNQVASIAGVLGKHGEIDRVMWKKVRVALASSLSAGYLHESGLNEKIRRKVVG